LRSGKSNTDRDSYIAPAHANSNRYLYCDTNCHTETFTDAEIGVNTKAASHTATAPVAFINEEETHCSTPTSRREHAKNFGVRFF
jgi:hypothetical protein